ncbi:sensor histidine kinase [Flavobacterium xinjiangense]|uniref:Histidine kinase n=1 Tax=Flavobacterium xinjiangense TaxID=178356 RepID=A0A1M7PFL9_9FLAO|nr:sensor histidine kinase [Flavobacterium xinjiangense]SHN15824.1 Histidine kinase [Flavobacterium xinjiangense]
MKKSIVILLHIGFWMCYFLLILIMLTVFYRSSSHAVDQTARIVNAFNSLLLFAFFPSFITFYSCSFIVFPKYLQQNKFLLSTIFGILISIGVSILAYIIMRYFIESGHLIDMDKDGINQRSTAINTIMAMSFIASISGLAALILKGFITWVKEIKLKEELKQKNHETEMALVKAQIDPHFLFNTLNNIDVLILKDAGEASNYLNKLSDILRFMLYEIKTDAILLKKEIEYIEKYIELQKIRTANSNYVSFQINGTMDNRTIAPMVFIPFIENAFKHSTNKKIDNTISIEIYINKENIIFLCENKFDPTRLLKQESDGLGNDLIQKRLNLIYPEKHILELENRINLYSVKLTIKNE